MTASTTTTNTTRGIGQGRLCTLRPLSTADEAVLYRAALDPDSGHEWRFRGLNLSPEAFNHALHDRVLSQFIVDDVKGDPVGLVMAYDYEPNAGHVHTRESW